jgi:hypothetical protein
VPGKYKRIDTAPGMAGCNFEDLECTGQHQVDMHHQHQPSQIGKLGRSPPTCRPPMSTIRYSGCKYLTSVEARLPLHRLRHYQLSITEWRGRSAAPVHGHQVTDKYMYSGQHALMRQLMASSIQRLIHTYLGPNPYQQYCLLRHASCNYTDTNTPLGLVVVTPGLRHRS